MWQPRRHALQVRQARLQMRSGDLRERLAQDAQSLQGPLALADRVNTGVHWLKARPYWLAALAAVPALLRPRRALSWTLRLWAGWKVWRRIAGLMG